MVWTRVHAKSRVVSASQPFFLYLICVGVLLVAGGIVPSAIDESIASTSACTTACNVVPWLYYVGISVILSAYSTKTHRILTILNNAESFKVVTVMVKDLMKPMVCLLVVNILILAVMTGVAPSRWETAIVEYDDFGRPSETLGSCIYTDQTWYLISPTIVNFGVLFGAIWQSFKARHLSLEFSESRHILHSMLIVVLLASVGIPVYFTASNDTSAQLFVFSAITFIGCSSTLLFMFLPKMRQLSSHVARTSTGTESSLTASSDASDAGMKIITRKTAAELAKETDLQARVIDRLNKELQQKTREIEDLRALIGNSDDSGSGNNNDTGLVNEMAVP